MGIHLKMAKDGFLFGGQVNPTEKPIDLPGQKTHGLVILRFLGESC